MHGPDRVRISRDSKTAPHWLPLAGPHAPHEASNFVRSSAARMSSHCWLTLGHLFESRWLHGKAKIYLSILPTFIGGIIVTKNVVASSHPRAPLRAQLKNTARSRPSPPSFERAPPTPALSSGLSGLRYRDRTAPPFEAPQSPYLGQVGSICIAEARLSPTLQTAFQSLPKRAK
jgi:hypothetical protein